MEKGEKAIKTKLKRGFQQLKTTRSQDSQSPKSIGARSTIRRTDDVDAFSVQNGIKGTGEFRIVIVEQKSNPRIAFLKLRDHRGRLLANSGWSYTRQNIRGARRTHLRIDL